MAMTGTNAAGIETRHAILDAAETLFSQHGYEGTSVREITRLADVNVAAVHYHFGRKQDVLRAVTDRVIEPLNDRRKLLLDELEGDSTPIELERIVEAFVRPDVEQLQSLGDRGGPIGRFLGRIYSDPSPWIREMIDDQFRPIGSRFIRLVADTVTGVSTDELEWRFEQITGVIVRMFMTWPTDGPTHEDAELLIRRMTRFSAAALSAPSTEGSRSD
jgi:AcrR family transcriptional regulator